MSEPRRLYIDLNGDLERRWPSEPEFFRLLQLRGAVRLESLGMRHSSGRSVTALAKREYGLKGNRAKVLEQLNAMIEAAKAAKEGE